MGKLVKTEPTLFVNEESKQAEYVAVPKYMIWFHATKPELWGILEGKADYQLSDRPMDHFQGTKEAFEPNGHRKVLPFTAGNKFINSIIAKPSLEKSRLQNLTLKTITEDGEQPFDGPITLHIRVAEGDSYPRGSKTSPHGTVWLASGPEKGPLLKREELFISLVLEAARLDRLIEEVFSRPGAILSVGLKFSFFQSYAEHRYADMGDPQACLLEPDHSTPIVEYMLRVVSGQIETSEASDVSDVAEDKLPKIPSAPVIMGNPLIAQQLNWVIGLLALLFILTLFK